MLDFHRYSCVRLRLRTGVLFQSSTATRMRLSLASSLFLASALVAASPLENRAGKWAYFQKSVWTWSESNPDAYCPDAVALTTVEYDNLKYYAQYAASAYCNSEDAAGASVTCEGGCPDVMANGATILGVLP